MANANITSNPVPLTAVVQSLVFGNGSPFLPSTHVFQFVGASVVGLSITVKARVTNSGLAFTEIPYVRRTLAGVAQDDTPVIAALTGDFTIKVDSTGLDLMLDVTAWTSGTGTLGYRVVAGADA